MSAQPVVVDDLDLAGFRGAVGAALARFLDEQVRKAAHPCMSSIVEVVRDFLVAGGKRLRPVFCYCGWCAAGGATDSESIINAAAALELLHAFALIHDDVMDASDLRRGRPTVHRRFAVPQLAIRGGRAAKRFGVNVAILIGDLCLVWSDELLHRSGLDPARLTAGWPVLDAMRTELMIGQYLDLVQAGTAASAEAAVGVTRFKTAKYTVERPLQLGGAYACGDAEFFAACTSYGLPIGEAFQLRDDVLGVFGDPAVTGKSQMDDLREGKNTVLTALATERADPDQAALMRRLHGAGGLDEDGARRIRQVIVDTGALATVEEMIRQRRASALGALQTAPFTPPAKAAMARLAVTATVRTT